MDLKGKNRVDFQRLRTKIDSIFNIYEQKSTRFLEHKNRRDF